MTLPVDLLSGNVINYYAKPNTGARIGEAIGKGAARFGDIVGQGIQRERERAFRQQQERSRLAEQKALAKYKFDLDKEGRDLRQRLLEEDAAAKTQERERKSRTEREKQFKESLKRFARNEFMEGYGRYGFDEKGNKRRIYIDSSEILQYADRVADAVAGNFLFRDFEKMSPEDYSKFRENVVANFGRIYDNLNEEGLRKDRRRLAEIEARKTRSETGRTDRTDKDERRESQQKIKSSIKLLGQYVTGATLSKTTIQKGLVSALDKRSIRTLQALDPQLKNVLEKTKGGPAKKALTVLNMLTNPLTQKEYKTRNTGLGLHNDANIYAFNTQDTNQIEALVQTKSRSPYMIAAANVYNLVQEVRNADPNYGNQSVNRLLETFQLVGTAGNLPGVTVDDFLNIYRPLSAIQRRR